MKLYYALVKWIESWSYRCDHNWEFLGRFDVYEDYSSKRPYETKHSYRCTKCCEAKTIKV